MSQFKKLKETIEKNIKYLDENYLNKIARETSFVQRSTNKVSGRDFVELMSLEYFGNEIVSLEGLGDILRTKSPESDITSQALSKKINSKNAVAFLERVFEAIYKEQLRSKLDKIPLGVLGQFSNVYLQDSTQISLNEHLWYCYSTMEREVSAIKLIQWLQRKGRLCQSIVNNKLSTLMEELVNSLPKGLLKQKRQRKTTIGLIVDQIGFLESFL